MNAAKNGVNALWVTVTTKIVVLQEFSVWKKIVVLRNGWFKNVISLQLHLAQQQRVTLAVTTRFVQRMESMLREPVSLHFVSVGMVMDG